jgi:hypothetical protein
MTEKKIWFITGADAIGLAEQKVVDLQQEIDALRHRSTSPAYEVNAGVS